jgi:catechol 1,2-dioxygenase
MRDDRVKTVVEDLERLLLDFMRKHRITHHEYRCATDILVGSVKAGEESLLYDIFLEAEATDIGNIGRESSPEAIEGPFYLPGAPRLEPPFIMPQRPNEAGDVLFFRGRITGPDGEPLAGAELDLWQADANGFYSHFHPGIPEWNLRGRCFADADGSFEVQTILPPPYEIPKAGPAGRVLKAVGRHFFRPAHLHLKLRYDGFDELTSQLYFQGGKYLDSDVAGGVRDGLVTSLTRRSNPADLAARHLTKPYFEVRHDFVLAPRQAPHVRIHSTSNSAGGALA